MPQKLVTSCDVCGVSKGETNHWFMARAKLYFFETFPWTENMVQKENLLYLCSESCLTKAMIRSVCGQSINRPLTLETESSSE